MDTKVLCLEPSKIVVTPIRSVHIGKECHVHLSLIQEIHPQTNLAAYGYYRLAVKDDTGLEPYIHVLWTREEALEAFSNQLSTMYYANIN